MDIYNLVMKIPYLLMLLVGVTLILQLFVGGLNSISIDIDRFNQDRFRSAVVLENTLSVEEETGEINFNYDHRRAVTPLKFYTVEAGGPDEIGYMEDGENCYIPRVAGLDGENFGFYIRKLDPDMSVNLDCTSRPSDRSDTVFSPVMLVRGDGPPVPARLYVYAK
jgi:hypothetical protein